MAYVRKTKDEWAFMANYGYGWEELFREYTQRDAYQTLKEYRENEPYTSFKIVKKRVPIA